MTKVFIDQWVMVVTKTEKGRQVIILFCSEFYSPIKDRLVGYLTEKLWLFYIKLLMYKK